MDMIDRRGSIGAVDDLAHGIERLPVVKPTDRGCDPPLSGQRCAAEIDGVVRRQLASGCVARQIGYRNAGAFEQVRRQNGEVGGSSDLCRTVIDDDNTVGIARDHDPTPSF